MRQVFLSTTTQFKEIDHMESGSWINLINPTQSESIEVANEFNIDISDLRAPLDLEEMSRVTIEDDYTLIIVDVPITEERNNKIYYVTIPLGIILTDDVIITTCQENIPLLDVFVQRRLRNFYTFMRSRFVFQILYRNAELYLTALRSIDRKSDQIETVLLEAPRNEELIELMELEKTIVYFKASLKTNERVVRKLTSSSSTIKKYLEDEDLLEDTLIETQQAIEMADIYGNILRSMTDTFASIISNNQNNIMKTLALVTIVMSIPTMIFSAYGMNFKNNDMPLNGEPHAFWIIIAIAFAMSLSMTLYLIHKKLF
ncbi:magnesium transporter CorA family protein [Streptococcus danieliae]|uniref:Magnesium transporter CorA family protein n=1 Tax=Streptococcus danieliae TaxID=747656 RepID=A0A7Z0LCC9_9STRE|nr:magnesium transporter CorA family protein [Streptococcus danieliae]MBF0699514.1 magnesium transporter CorA family protein [Streptococcus danieliae]MBF0716814.1 magnesium transporter CorA family protein [Streptococcus danieliae]NYS48744.1 magnesium transporter CorA family protein [Streptococcus danieliae]NYS96690.1 magnesium transporter CorA family protein [Streptococcus danieliae]